MTKARPQRIRCPVHNLIEFGTDELESTLWQVIQTPTFQRLRRIRQLGFSEFVFPGATHTRFAHSLGVFHIARALMKIIERHVKAAGGTFRDSRKDVTLAAALLHDVGHGMFSHAFEQVGKELKLPMAQHEHVSAMLVREGRIAEILNQGLGRGTAEDVAALIGQKVPISLYDAVVSSQFDADRLDYMQRDRLMCGVRSSSVDPTWLLANLQIASVPLGTDDNPGGEIETLVLGPKAVQTAESYVLALFHLYPNVYLHKATRGAEAMFAALMRRLLRLGQEGQSESCGLPANHPIRRFVDDPSQLDRAVALDDAVFWGALPMLAEAQEREAARLAVHLRDRRLPHCIDIRQRIEAELPSPKGEEHAKFQARVMLACTRVESALKAWTEDHAKEPERILLDRYSRPPYKPYRESPAPLSRIFINTGSGTPRDMAELSPVIAHAESFNICRAYVFRDDSEAADVVENEIRTSIESPTDANP